MKVGISIFGAQGRMGQRIDALVKSDFKDRAQIVHHLDRDSDMSTLNEASCVIDFSLPEGTQRAIEFLNGKKNLTFVSGTTGLSSSQQEQLKSLGKDHRIAWSSNFSIGVFALRKILRAVTPMLKSLHYAPEIDETHHVHKKDRPSGTALTLKQELETFYSDLPEVISHREGEVIGTHCVQFKSDNDMIELKHQALDRDIFARGAIEFAIWLSGKEKTGFYTMDDFFEDQFS